MLLMRAQRKWSFRCALIMVCAWRILRGKATVTVLLHISEMLKIFLEGKKIRLHVDTDEICSACPNNRGGHCEAGDKVAEYDNAVLERCGLKAGQTLYFSEFTKKVQEKILAMDKRKEICGNCQWNSICEEQKSRWA